MARQGIGMGRTIWGEARMSATYFNKRGDGHSIRGTMAREQGAVAWSKLPATLRRGLSVRDAIDAENPLVHVSQVLTYEQPRDLSRWSRIMEATVKGVWERRN